MQAPGARVEVWFQDEGRIGQKNSLTRVWGQTGSISVGAASTDGDDVDPERPIAVACAPRALPRPAGHGRMIMRRALVRKPLAQRVDRRDAGMSAIGTEEASSPAGKGSAY